MVVYVCISVFECLSVCVCVCVCLSVSGCVYRSNGIALSLNCNQVQHVS